MAFIIPRNQTIGEALQQAFALAAPGLIQGAHRRTAEQKGNEQFQQSLAGLTGGQQNFQPQASAFGGLPGSLGLPQPQIPLGQQQFDRFSGITDPATRQAILGGLAGQQFADPFGVEAARAALLRKQGEQVGLATPQTPEQRAATVASTAKTKAETGQIGEPTPISPEERKLKIAQANKLIKETNLLETTLTQDEQRRRDLIKAGLSPAVISKQETKLLKSQIAKNRAESEKLLRESNGKLTPDEISKQSTTLRKEFNALSKDFFESRDAFTRVKASAVDPSAAGDLALIFNFMKVLDPSSVVRESEFANAAATGAFGERIKGSVAKVINGQRLSAVVRKDFLDRATRLFKAQEGNQSKLSKRYTALSKRFGVDPAGVIDVSAGVKQDATSPSRQSLNVQDLDNMSEEQLRNL